MGIEINWHDEAQTVIVMRYGDSYTWEDLDNVTRELHKMLNSVLHRVDLIMILNPNVQPPKGGNFIARLNNIIKNMPSNLGLYINVGQGNSFTRMIANMVLKIYPTSIDFRSVGTEDEAHQLIETDRQKLAI